MDKLYTIQEVATKLNLSDKTLRRWEEAGRFTSSRTLGNQRRYSLEDLQILDAIKHGTINEQKDLLTIDQAGKICGVSPTTILRWEETGKIHPFITSGNTYYPRQKLIEKMDELKKIYVEPAPKGSDFEGRVQPRNLPSAEGQTPKDYPERTDPQGNSEPKLTPLNTQAIHTSPLQHKIYLANALITLILIFAYHLFFNQTSVPVSPQTGLPAQVGSVQGASTTITPDPRLDDLITKFQDHLSTEMLNDAKPTTTKLDNVTLVSGTATLPKGESQISIPADQINPTTPITVSFTTDFAPAKKYWVTANEGAFTVSTDFPVSMSSPFNYSFVTPISTTSAIIKP